MEQPVLPARFSELSKYVPEWVHATERGRNAFRVRQPLSSLKAFYADMLPRLADISEYLNDHPLHALPRECANLLELALMTMEVAPAVEYYDAPDVPNAVDFDRFEIYSVSPKYHVTDG